MTVATRLTFVVSLILSVATATADPVKIPELKTSKATYKDVTVISINDDGATIMHHDGGGVVPWSDLTDDEKQLLGYYGLKNNERKAEEAEKLQDQVDDAAITLEASRFKTEHTSFIGCANALSDLIGRKRAIHSDLDIKEFLFSILGKPVKSLNTVHDDTFMGVSYEVPSTQWEWDDIVTDPDTGNKDPIVIDSFHWTIMCNGQTARLQPD